MHTSMSTRTALKHNQDGRGVRISELSEEFFYKAAQAQRRS